ncbi:acyl-CoA dehydrogenase [Actinomadura sp. NBRC 104425]|uniref:acyl-CoA dehydrogenase family protein n=1 Tax=Actinomadura sp. NBRC 104425 TaxID=3032204 RepID=UPI0024A56E25|nr:acyl-CoA dehydrogenase family protein [Actinomadura sp. NBRC 104425]GLZ10860.1 acyl-CoA dehydrogenase [Actinomadura sp. NBRC 104425]
MDFGLSERARDHLARLQDFMDAHVYPAEPVYAQQRRELRAAGREHALPPIVEELKAEARRRGLWNLFLPARHPGGQEPLHPPVCEEETPSHGLSVVDYASLAEVTGRVPHIAPEALNCSAPDTGNMEVLHLFGTPEQKKRWLVPLLNGEIRSAFAMTEPDVASSDARNISTRIERDGDHYVINGRKWWISGSADPRCKILIVMGKTDPDGPAYRQQSMVLVPVDTPGVEIVRSLPVFGYSDQEGHCEIRFTDVRVPVENLVGEEGGGFAIAQARLGPGRIHHCMRALGMAERALELMCERAVSRVAFGKELARQGVIQQWIAESRMAIEQARLLTLKTAWLIDTEGVRAARSEVSAIKVVAPRVALDVLDKAIQVHGGAGVSDDTPLAAMWAGARTLRLADGPDEVHVRSVARTELGKYLGR